MQIYVEGVGGKKLHKELSAASEFYASLLMDPRMVRKICLDIEVERDLDCHGECVNEPGTKNPREFTIRLLYQDKNEMLIALAHEMVHLKQHAKNELYKDLWKGSIWKPKAKECSYYDSPWEIEAFGRQEGLFERFIQLKERK